MKYIIYGFNTLLTVYQYNSQDQITYLTYQSGQNDFKKYKYVYDYAGRLKDVNYWTEPEEDNPSGYYKNFTSYSYNANSQIESQESNEGGLRNNFYYNNRNWIIEAQESKGAFEYTNDYFKNGNVKSQTFEGDYKRNFTNTADLNFAYTYDKSNRLLKGTTSNKVYEVVNTYDKDGNILTLKRYNGMGGLADDFSYTYYSGTNKLSKVTGSTNQYTYDANGNMTGDDINRNTNIKYDYRNLIIQLQHKEYVFEDSIITVTYSHYDEAGNRIGKITFKYTGTGDNPDAPANNQIGLTDDWEIVSDIVYSRGVDGKELAIYNNPNLIQWNVWGTDNTGKIINDGGKYFYCYEVVPSGKSHLSEWFF